MSALNESFLSRLSMKPTTRTALHHKIKWDGQDTSFPLFKKQYEAYLLASQQDYAADPEFRRAYIEQGDKFVEMCRTYEISPAQVAADTKQQFGALSMACSGNDDGQRFLGMYPRDGLRAWHEMVHWFQYGGSVEVVLGQLESDLQQDYNDNHSGGIIAYINMIANTYAKQRQVIKDNPECDTYNPTDLMKMRHVKTKLQGTTYALGVHQDYQSCIKENATFDIFLSRIRATVAYIDKGNLHVARRRARIAQSIVPYSDDAIHALIAQTDPLYLNESLLQIMNKIDPIFTRKFLQARNRQLARTNRAPSDPVTDTVNDKPAAPPGGTIPRQYTDQPRTANVSTTSIACEPAMDDRDTHQDAIDDTNDDDDSLTDLVRDHYALLMRWHDASKNDATQNDRKMYNFVTIRTDYQRAVRAALAYNQAGRYSTVSDGGADTWILGAGWRIIARTTRSTNVVGFDSNYAKKKNLPIVVGCAVVRDHQERDILIVVFDGVSNADSPVSLLGEFQTREAGNIVDSVARTHKHWDGTPGNQGMRLCHPLDGTQQLPETIVPFQVQQALMVFGHRPPTDDELTSLPRFLMTPQTPWKPPDHMTSDDVILPCVDCHQMAFTAITDILDHRTCPSLNPSAVTGGPTPVPVTPISVEIQDTLYSTGSYLTGGNVTGGDDPTASINNLNTLIPTDGQATGEPSTIRDSNDATINLGCFMDAITNNDDDLYFYDPSDDTSARARLGKAFHLTIDYEFVREHVVDDFLSALDDDELIGLNEPFDTFVFGVRTAATLQNAERLQPYLGYRPLEVIRRTIEVTTQLGATVNYHNLKAHLKSLLPWANRTRLNKTVSTDTVFASEKDVTGALCAQVFYGLQSHVINVYGMKSESEGSDRLNDFMREEGIPTVMRSDNSRMQRYGRSWLQRLREMLVHAEYSEPHNQQQNPVELRAVRWLKDAGKTLRKRTGAPGRVWLQSFQYMADIHNVTADETLDWRTPKSVRNGTQTDISPYVQFQFWEPVTYLDTEEKFPSTKEKMGRWVGVAHNVGDFFCWKIYDEITEVIIERSVVSSRLGTPNKAAEEELRQIIGIDDDTSQSSESSVEFSPNQLAVKPDKDRTKRLRERRERRKEMKAKRKTKKSTVIAGIPTATQSCNDVLVDETLQQAAEEHALSVIQEEDDSETVSPQPVITNDQHQSTENHHELPVKTEQIDKPDKEATSDESVTFDVEPPPARKDPLAPSPMLQEAPHTLRRSSRHINKPSRFLRSMFTRTAALIILPLVPTHCTFIGTHDHMVPAAAIPTPDWTYALPTTPTSNISRAQAEYVRLCDEEYDTHNDPVDTREWTPLRILDHRIRRNKLQQRHALARVTWINDYPTWTSLDALRQQQPFLVIDYVYRRPELLKHPDFQWIRDYIDDAPKLQQAAKVFKLITERTPKYKFGVEVPTSIAHALRLDAQAGNTMWQDAINTEVKQLNDYKTFRLRTHLDNIDDYTRIPYHCVFDVKFDGRRKCRIVAGGNHTTPTKESVFSGVVNISSVRLGFLIASLNVLQICAADIGNAFLYGRTREKVYVRAGREFGAQLQGRDLIVDKSLYGLRTSSARFHEHLSAKLRSMGYVPSKADMDLWMKDCGSHYEYIARYVDDIIAFGKDPLATINEVKRDYILKGVGRPEYYLGGDVVELDATWHKYGISQALSAKTYAKNVVEKYEALFNMELRKQNSPMDKEYHPEADESEMLDATNASKFRGLVGSANWMITLGRYDIAYATSSLARFAMAPRAGHMKAMLRVFGYIKKHKHGQILVDPNYMNWDKYTHEQHDWDEFYPDATEELPPNMPEPRGKSIKLTVYKDADHAHDLVTRRSVTGILMFANNMPIEWISKRQKTVETSTYGSELVASRIATDLIVEYRYKFRMLGIPIDGPALMLGDNASVITSTTTPSSPLRKKHNAVAYHRVREAIAAGIVRFAKVDSSENLSDCLTKPLRPDEFMRLVKPVLFRTPHPFGNKVDDSNDAEVGIVGDD
jgi:hypothetical protein